MADQPYTWRVFKYADDRTDNTWREVGTADSQYAYGGPDIQKIGELYGVGRYLFLKIDGYGDVRESQIIAESYYTEAEEEPAPLAAVES